MARLRLVVRLDGQGGHRRCEGQSEASWYTVSVLLGEFARDGAQRVRVRVNAIADVWGGCAANRIVNDGEVCGESDHIVPARTHNVHLEFELKVLTRVRVIQLRNHDNGVGQINWSRVVIAHGVVGNCGTLRMALGHSHFLRGRVVLHFRGQISVHVRANLTFRHNGQVVRATARYGNRRNHS